MDPSPRLPGAAATHLEDALLLTSELVTNAVRYGSPPLTLHLALDGDTLRVDVGDANRHPPASDSGEAEGRYAETGRGLHILTGRHHRPGTPTPP